MVCFVAKAPQLFPDDDVRRGERLANRLSFAKSQTAGNPIPLKEYQMVVDRSAVSALLFLVALVSDGDPSSRHTVGPDLVRTGTGFSGGEGPTGAAWSLVIELAAFPHGHFHDCDANEIRVFAHLALSRSRHRMLRHFRLARRCGCRGAGWAHRRMG